MIENFNEYEFRSHAVGKLMTGINGMTDKQVKLLADLHEKEAQKGLTDNQKITLGDLLNKKKIAKNPPLSRTAKSYLEEIFKSEVFGKSKHLTNKYLDKGLMCEEDSLALISKHYNSFFVKNKEHFSNGFIKGTPDNTQEIVRDIKTSWDFLTFPILDTEIPNKVYYWQLQAYMELTGLKKAELIYCLVDTPEEVVNDEKRKMIWAMNSISEDLPQDLDDEITNNAFYSNLPQELRIKVFPIEYNKDDIAMLYVMIEKARSYLNEKLENLVNDYHRTQVKN